jgi:methylated-DNA-[protein]-cysteine S-methyltransferase
VGIIHIQYCQSRVGELILGAFNGQLCLLDFRYRKMRERVDKRIKERLNADYVEHEDPVLDLTMQQLDEFFAGDRKEFDLPLLMVGSDFQKRVWSALKEIPYGKTTSYLELSKSINAEKAVRAVAAANGANAMSMVIPCHRVIGSDGELIGYGGGLAAKKRLLQLEQAAGQMTLDF